MEIKYVTPEDARIFIRTRKGTWKMKERPMSKINIIGLGNAVSEDTNHYYSFRTSTLYSYFLIDRNNPKNTRLIRYTGHVLLPGQEVYFLRVLSGEAIRAIKVDKITNSLPDIPKDTPDNTTGGSNSGEVVENPTLELWPNNRIAGELAPHASISICRECFNQLFGGEAKLDGDPDNPYQCSCQIKSLCTDMMTAPPGDDTEQSSETAKLLQFGPHSMPITIPSMEKSWQKDVDGVSDVQTDIHIKLTVPPRYFHPSQAEMVLVGSLDEDEATRCQIRGPCTRDNPDKKSHGNWLSSVTHVIVCKLVKADDPSVSINFPLEVLFTRQWGSRDKSYKGMFVEKVKRKEGSVKDIKGSFTKARAYNIDGNDVMGDGFMIAYMDNEVCDKDVPRLPVIPRPSLSPLSSKELVNRLSGNQKTLSSVATSSFPIVIGHRGLGSNKIHFVSGSNKEVLAGEEKVGDLLVPITPAYRENTVSSFDSAFNIGTHNTCPFAGIGIETDLQPVECDNTSSRWTDPASSSVLEGKNPFCGIGDIAICHEFMAPLKSKGDNLDKHTCETILSQSKGIKTLRVAEDADGSAATGKEETKCVDVKLLSSEYVGESTPESAPELVSLYKPHNEYNTAEDKGEPKERLLTQMTKARFLASSNDAPWTAPESTKEASAAHKSFVTDAIYECVRESVECSQRKKTKVGWVDVFNKRFSIPNEVTQLGSAQQHDAVPIKALLSCSEGEDDSASGDSKHTLVRPFQPAKPALLSDILRHLTTVNTQFQELIKRRGAPSPTGSTQELQLFMNLEVKSLCRRVPWSPSCCYESKKALRGVLQHPPRFGLVNKELSVVSAETYRDRESGTALCSGVGRCLPVFFSSFDWMTVLLLTSQQNTYPVLYLTLGDEWTEREMHRGDDKRTSILPPLEAVDSLLVSDDYSDVPVHDPLARVLPYAFTLCNGEEHGVDGVVSCVKGLRAARQHQEAAGWSGLHKGRATLLTYGSSVRDLCTTSFLFGGCGVDGVIVDGL